MVTAFVNGAVLLWLLGMSAGADFLALVPVLGSLLLFASSGTVLLWPRVGSAAASLFLLCIGLWPLLSIIRDPSTRDHQTLALFSCFLALIALSLWFTAREALGRTRHSVPSPAPGAYVAIASAVAAVPPLLLCVYFGFLFASGAISFES
ncbi:MAG: hypothetical protein ABIR71_10415 [Chthoniobacterales bacterium]